MSIRWYLRLKNSKLTALIQKATCHRNCVSNIYVLVKEGDSITIDANNRWLQLNVSDAELEQRRTLWQPPKPRYTKGVLAKYAKLVSSSSVGAVTDLGLG